MMTKEEEYIAFSRFIKKLLPNSNYEFKQREQPDIELGLEGKRIGVELTEIMDNDERAKQMLRKRIGEQTVIELVKRDFPPFHLNLDFSDYLNVSKRQISTFAQEVADRIVQSHGNRGFNNSYHHDFQDNFSAQYELINDCISYGILFSNSFSQAYYSESGSAIIPNLHRDRLQQIIRKKEGLLTNYQYFEEYWLLIIEGNFIAGSIAEIKTGGDPIPTAFSQVFIFRQATQTIEELKTQYNSAHARQLGQ